MNLKMLQLLVANEKTRLMIQKERLKERRKRKQTMKEIDSTIVYHAHTHIKLLLIVVICFKFPRARHGF